jgi:hypothetical protein
MTQQHIARVYPPSIHDRVSIRSAWPENPEVPPRWGQKKKEKGKKNGVTRPRISLADALSALR